MDQKLDADIHLIKVLNDLEEELKLFIDAQQDSQQANGREPDEIATAKPPLQTKGAPKKRAAPASIPALESELESESAQTPASASVPASEPSLEPEPTPTPTSEPGHDPDDFVS